VCLIDNVVIIYQAFRYELDPTNIQRVSSRRMPVLLDMLGTGVSTGSSWHWRPGWRQCSYGAERHGIAPHVEHLEEAAGQLLLVV
jgi:hypothetical protein